MFHVGLNVFDGNQLLPEHKSVKDDQGTVRRVACDPDCSSKAGHHLQKNSKEHHQLREGNRDPDASFSSERNWERQGARPKRTQKRFPVGVDDRRSHNGGLIPESQSRQFGEKEAILGSFTTSDTLEKSDFILPCPVSSSTVSSPMVVSDPTSRLSLPVASDIKSSVLDTNGNSVSSPTVEGDGNEESSLIASEQGTAKQEFTRELHRKEQLKGASLKRQSGMHTLLILLYMLMSHSNNVLNGV